jgi:hypothetical protein
MNKMPKNKSAKAHFEAPKLQVYGRARDITRAVGNQGNGDGGVAPNHKTQP